LEYLLGATLTVIIVIIANRLLVPSFKETSKVKLRYSQSHIYNLMAPLLDYAPKEIHKKETQARKHMKQAYVRVVIMDNNAYWIKDNALYVADLVEGAVDKESAKRVDTMKMDKVELDKTMFVVEKLREGLGNENSGSGKQ
jgi:hypothetical protein